jgi:teichuronic acid biosynthesis glycosyltransferase TuaH
LTADSTEPLSRTDGETPVVSPSETRRGLIVLCAANNYNAVKGADQHMAENLARNCELLYVDPPQSRVSLRRNPALATVLEEPTLRRTSTGFWRLTPVVPPFPMRRGMRSITEQLVKRAIRRAVAAIAGEATVLITSWATLDVSGICNERLKVWWAQDDFAAGAELMGISQRPTAAGQLSQARSSDFVVAINPDVAERWQSEGCEVELIPNGCDPQAFASVGEITPSTDVQLAPPIAVMMGQFNDRTDPRLLRAVVDAGMSLLLVGPAAGATWISDLGDRENVAWVGAQPFEALPRYLAHAQVGLVPYTDSDFNRASFPLKTLEYLAAGLPVVTTDLPSTRWLKADPELVRIADDPESFAAAAVTAAASQDAAATARRREFAGAHSYAQRTRDLLAAIDRRLGNQAEA